MALNYQNPTPELIRTVWNKGAPIIGYDSNVWRRDHEGKAMQYSEYGKRSSTYGWEIDHITPASRGGSDALSNLRPRHWEGNAAHGGRLGG